MYYEDEKNLYHYSYRKGDSSNPNKPVDTKNYAEEPWETPKPRKKRTGLKIAALALCCALLGGVVGVGVSRAFFGANIGANASIDEENNTTAIWVSDREVAEIKTVKVTGGKELTMPEVYAANVGSVVSINVSSKSTNYFGQTVENAASGSGFIITKDGYIVTNYHVVEGASSVKITLHSGEMYDAKIIGGDEDYDIAVVKIEASDLMPVVLGDSSKLMIGETIAAIGNPLGELTFSMSQGIVSCVDRAINVDGTPFNMIQVDCSINPGNSGGPLVNTYGEVVGIVSAKYSSYSSTTVEGIGFAIPINDVVAMIEDIMTNGFVTNKPFIGITPGTMTKQMAQQYRYTISEGVFVYSVEPGSAADKAGLKMGDVITKIDDKEIRDTADLTAAKKSYSAGDTATFTIYRAGETMEVSLTFDVTPEDTTAEEPQSETPQNGGSYNPSGGGYFDPWSFFFGIGFGW